MEDDFPGLLAIRGSPLFRYDRISYPSPFRELHCPVGVNIRGNFKNRGDFFVKTRYGIPA
jgi:hypothetical protein